MAKTTSKAAPAPPVRRAGRAKSPDYSTLSVYIPKALHTRVKLAAIEDGRELSDVVETLIVQWLSGRSRKKV